MWLDPTFKKSADGNQSQPIKLIGVVSYGDPPPCGLAGAYASITSVVEWIEDVTSNCNKLTCSKGECVTKDKLLEDALYLFNGHDRLWNDKAIYQ